ncbi:MAG: amino acid ABC transporter ATP-binding protein [Myxococcales bacterium]|nr:amino acid ABC transporter ATP-binding protein [Polyangiaceae bacterium]MDW8252077.1 amino acid ABC transporter ATP-binding protein [Myxococcales bacterium]
MIRVHRIRKFHRNTPILDGLDLTVERGVTAALVGASGGGKSTLLRCLVGLEPFEEGEVRLGDLVLPPRVEEGRDATLLRAVRRRVGFVFQQYHLFPHLTTLENLTLAPVRSHGIPRRQAEERAREQLARVGLEGKEEAYPIRLSGGQQQRVAIARALMVDPEMLLLDEPTSALDPARVQELASLFEQLAADGLTLLLVTHSLSLVRRLARRVHVLDQGRIVEEGDPSEVLERPSHAATRALLTGP